MDQPARQWNSYALKHLAVHLCELGQFDEAVELVTCPDFLRTRCRLGGAGEAREGLLVVEETCLRAGRPDLAARVRSGIEQLAAASAEDSARPERDASFATEPALEGLLARSADGRRLACGVAGGSVRIWAADTGAEMLTLAGDEERVTCVAFSADGRLLAAGTEDGTIRVWDAVTAALLASLEGPLTAVHGIRFGADGDQVVTASAGGTLRVLDIGVGREVVCLRGEEQSPALGLHDLLRALQGLKQTVFNSTQAETRERAKGLLLRIARGQVLGRLRALDTETAPDLAAAVLEEALDVLPNEHALAMCLAELRARQGAWDKLYEVIDRARLASPSAEAIERLAELEKATLWPTISPQATVTTPPARQLSPATAGARTTLGPTTRNAPTSGSKPSPGYAPIWPPGPRYSTRTRRRTAFRFSVLCGSGRRTRTSPECARPPPLPSSPSPSAKPGKFCGLMLPHC